MGRGTQQECTTCNKNMRVSQHNPKCSDCTAAFNRAYYKQNAEKRKAQQALSRESKKELKRDLVWNYLDSHPCVDCGESDPIVLEFDHRDPNEKEYQISYLLTGNWSIDKIVSELAKCDVRCANCHRRRSVDQFGHWKGRRGN